MFWGKIKEGNKLPLSYHCLDVAMVFRFLVDLPLIHRLVEKSIDFNMNSAQLDRLAVIAFLHDIGKTNLGFQDKPFNPKALKAGHIQELAPLFFEPDLCNALTVSLDLETLESWFLTPEALEGMLLAAWSHHGAPVRFDPAIRTGSYHLAKTLWWRTDGTRDPLKEIFNLMVVARKAFPKAFEPNISTLPPSPRLQHLFAGVLMLADWLGSHESFFPILRETDNPITFSGNAAERAIRSVGLFAEPYQSYLNGQSEDFEQRFGFKPRPLQSAIEILSPEDNLNRLLIAEAETGSGKTEAALEWFFRLFSSKKVDALYFALPTRVAARELYLRVCRYIERVFPNEDVRPSVLLAVPGYARMDNVPVKKILPSDHVMWNDDKYIQLHERTWAAEHPKRFLAATVAVGTIDQALLSAIQTRHAHLRSVCLDRSLLVVDEVHASDHYSQRLLTGLLTHHLALGGYAMLLSATLGSSARTAFLQAAGYEMPIPDFKNAVSAPYPSLTNLAGEFVSILPSTYTKTKHTLFELKHSIKNPELIISDISQAIGSGSRVLVILNTVNRALLLQKSIEADQRIANEAFFCCNGVIAPHHGRFAPPDREILDEAVSKRLGKDSPPGPLLLIGTQTLEQSLDIDADLLITDLCPADVLLQRVGRLHRHDRKRPSDYEAPKCLILIPEINDLEELLDKNGKPKGWAKKMGLGSVYEDIRTLELTRRTLFETPNVVLPQDNRRLVESATLRERLESLKGGLWNSHGQNVYGAELAKEISASLIKAVYDRPFGDPKSLFSELRGKARTRLGLDTMRIPLANPVESPFGCRLTEILIPGHMVPHNISEEVATVDEYEPGIFHISYCGRNYKYSRFGLELNDESPDRSITSH
jgi:CRISPR-associated endonuclease/helicase Cas3